MTTQPLWSLKEWLTLEDASHLLSTEFGERITATDILRFGLKGRLELSCNFVNSTPAVFGRVISIGTRKAVFFPMWNGQVRAVWMSPGSGRRPVLDKPLELADEIEPIRGVWDLLMIEDTPHAVECLYHRMTDGPKAQPDIGDGILISSTDGKVARLQVDGELRHPQQYHIHNYRLAHDLPTDGVLVVRPAALMEFIRLTTNRRSATDSGGSAHTDFVGISDIIPTIADKLVDTQTASWQREEKNNATRREVAIAFAEMYLQSIVKKMVDSGALVTINGRPADREFLTDVQWGVTGRDAELLRKSLPRDLSTELWSTVNEKANKREEGLARDQAWEKAMRAAGLYTILEAWQILSHATGIDASRWRQTMLRDIYAGKLPLRNPHNPRDRLPYDVPLAILTVYDKVDAQSLNKWLDANSEWTEFRYPVGEVDDKKPTAQESSESLSVRQHQGREIVRVIQELGHDPKALPKGPSGKKGIKAQVRACLNFTTASFDHTWKWLRETGTIANKH
jgi:hypothetical protein